VLTWQDVDALVDMGDAVSAVEDAFAAHGRGAAQMPPKVYIDLPEHAGDFRAMPAALEGAVGVKWVNSHPRNPARHGLPSVMGVYVLSDPATALPLAVLDATRLTALRTGAAAAVATRHLARSGAKTCAFIGCGVQARTLHAAIRSVRDDLDWLCADADHQAARALAAEIGGDAVTLEAAAGADIVNTATPVSEPIVRRAWLRPGAHVNAMGADAHGKQELDVEVLREGRVFVDDRPQASGSGEVNVPLSRGEIAAEDIAGTLGEVVTGAIPGRQSDEQITLFDSTGLAVQDVALARVIYERALREDRGLEVQLVPER
jgi:ornithine cyclodeaminase/alanine dehydrogenase